MSSATTTLIGNITADPELTFTKAGQPRLAMSIAVNRSWQTNGEWQEEVSYFDLTAWRNVAENSASVLEKGMRVVVTGYPKQESWEDKNGGGKRSKVVFVVDEIAVSTKSIESMVRKRGGTDSPASGSATKAQTPRRNVPAAEEPF